MKSSSKENGKNRNIVVIASAVIFVLLYFDNCYMKD